MNIRNTFFVLFIFILANPLQAQVLSPFSGSKTKKCLQSDIRELSSDAYEGRETGTTAEKKAAFYIASRFSKVGLKPKGDDGSFYQDFSFTGSISTGSSTSLTINRKQFKTGEDFYPLAYSATAKAEGNLFRAGYGIEAKSLGHNDYENVPDRDNLIFLIDIGVPDGDSPHSKFAEYADLGTRVEKAINHGAVAVIFIRTNKENEEPPAKISSKINPMGIPVIFANGSALKTLVDGDVSSVAVEVELVRNETTGRNVIGYMENNKSGETIIFGAHYDHLGFGDEGSLHRGHEKEIHNGADDNASGVAGIIELARMLKKLKLKKYNYLFIAFSGEEKGLFGSAYNARNPNIDLSKVVAMINYDMIGRLENADKALGVNGVGTSPQWKEILAKCSIKGMRVKTSESGIGPSDHTSYYLKDIPVLHMFSGTHSDYHKPSDDEDKINYEGIQDILNYTYQVTEQLNSSPRIAFSKTKNEDSEETPRFKVTLGVVPDYMFEEEGMRIDGVTEGKPASKANMLAGDIVIQMGEYVVRDMMSYMKALSHFKKGDTTKVKVKRGDKELEMDVTF